MKNMKKRFSVMFMVVIAYVAFSVSAQAASLTVDLANVGLLGGDNFWSYYLEFDLTDNTDTPIVTKSIANNQHKYDFGVANGFPAEMFMVDNWSDYSSVTNNGNILQVFVSENDALDVGQKAFLQDGTLVTINYGDSNILSLAYVEFLSSTDIVASILMQPSGVQFGAGDNLLTFSPSAVPVPGAAWLLGSGLLGLVGLRRKKA